MKKMSLLGLLAASLLTVTSCSNPDNKQDENVTVKALEYPAPVDTTGGKVDPATREINALNATEDIKKMQPVM
ncbi:hypothetical protein [Hymenobacter rubripertinctus]|uniref:Uncharacterized protein n=1 Tax=Hymenobacter rubripertinctus TaxID=2029981 RepID=A0A418R5Z5_9BACT|nr:hypothetical protein [Hymenobacter rubripertinctus]RIY12873.1 hypothetical protein D0T11_03875 [Hymenobacter rubripertinctus]